jgi:hypothetical protein
MVGNIWRILELFAPTAFKEVEKHKGGEYG